MKKSNYKIFNFFYVFVKTLVILMFTSILIYCAEMLNFTDNYKIYYKEKFYEIVYQIFK